MTPSAQGLSPELRELLGDIGKQRESVLLNVSRADLTKLVERPDERGIDRSIGRLSNAEKELLDCRKFELASAIHARVVASAMEAPELWSRGYVESRVRSANAARPIQTEEFQLPSVVSSDARAYDSLAESGPLTPQAASRVQSLAVKLVPTVTNRVLLGYALWHGGSADAAQRVGRGSAADAGTISVGSYAADLLAMIASEKFDTGRALGLYRRSSMLDPSRTAPPLEWIAQSIYVGDGDEAESATRAVLETASDEVVLESISAGRTAAKSDSRWVLSSAARAVATKLADHEDSRIARVAHVFL
ncbi:hypothetical protein [Engelhardtia mirabilis]|uniref:Uncharacterized protein n=1 Tax=Engelhardtia mirabilis TaxID=2528011 RepID=A0A518BE54_9BACT|nr:hypothetical protein Pla133_03150 [Planctomycetes bacterium Pla133]QDU99577.1 hypothetical protein Pla86_03150 [Planctomycetes bacterium Pla86]